MAHDSPLASALLLKIVLTTNFTYLQLLFVVSLSCYMCQIIRYFFGLIAVNQSLFDVVALHQGEAIKSAGKVACVIDLQTCQDLNAR